MRDGEQPPRHSSISAISSSGPPRVCSVAELPERRKTRSASGTPRRSGREPMGGWAQTSTAPAAVALLDTLSREIV